MTWQWMTIIVVLLVAGAALGAWWMKLVHDQEPIEPEE
jgi:hypothetical protein